MSDSKTERVVVIDLAKIANDHPNYTELKRRVTAGLTDGVDTVKVTGATNHLDATCVYKILSSFAFRTGYKIIPNVAAGQGIKGYAQKHFGKAYTEAEDGSFRLAAPRD